MVFITGDTHAQWLPRFSAKNFPEGKTLTKDDYVIICGDFGLWHKCNEEDYKLKWLNKKPWTTIFVDGNHENFDRLYSEFEEIEFNGAKAHKIRDSIYHIKRGEILQLEGKKFFCFGGARSHDIQDGIIDPNTDELWRKKAKRMQKESKLFRIKGISWWPEEFPSKEEMDYGFGNLEKINFDVDYVITHDAPLEFKMTLGYFEDELDDLNIYLQTISNNCPDKTKFYCGHYHTNCGYGQFNCLYETIERIE